MNIFVKSFRLLRLMKAMYNLQKYPENPEYVFDISDACNRLNMYGLSRDLLFNRSENRASIADMWLLPEIKLADLQQSPENSFAKVYADHMLLHGYLPDFWRKSEIHNDITYVTVRMRQTHDLWHVMTGFDVSVEGEIGLQGFVLAQTGLPIAMILVAGALLRAVFRDVKAVPRLMEAITHGWRMGKKAKQIFPIKWEEQWNRPLRDLQKEFEIDLAA